MIKRQIQHLFLRAGFGISLTQLKQVQDFERAQLVDFLFAQSNKPAMLNAVVMPTEVQLEMAMRKDKTAQEKKMIRQYEVEEDKKLNLAWIKKIMSGQEALNERMTFFWHDHFACRDINPIHGQSLNNAIRKNALGDFRALLLAVSQEPAMLKFLNNQQNRKNAPNENFAREVLELFTLGRGHYSEADIKNAARAFTGWGFDRMESHFEFRDKQHDYDSKTFLGTTGTLKGEDILNIIVQQKQCAYFITDKIYRYFVNEKVDQDIVKYLAESFYQSGYNIGSLMRTIFSADWFYDEENIGVRIKSPIELIASLGIQFTPFFEKERILLILQRILGQQLFNPPNVAGWPNGKEWIDSSSLVFRMSLGRKMIRMSEISTEPKPEDDKIPNEMLKKEARFNEMKSNIDWGKISSYFSAKDDQSLVGEVSDFLLQTDIAQLVQVRSDDGTSKADKLKYICSYITAMPEYQMC